MTDQERERQEALVDRYVAENRREEALRLLLDLIVSYAGEKNFEKAEALNEKLYEVDPLAITEIVRAAEVIEEAKKQGLDRKHLEIWSELYADLSKEESNALYYSMKSRDFGPGEGIMEQGLISDRLYFINHGEVKAIFRRGGEEVFLKTLGPGDVIGHDTFFSATVCTVSMIALGSVKTDYLVSDVLKKWKTDAPLLESKLYDFCMKRDRLKAEFEKKAVDRREHHRIALGGAIVFQLLNSSGKSMAKAYKGELADISAGGVSFLVKTSRPESIRVLLGRRLWVKFELVFRSGARERLELEGQVIAVQSQAFDDYSIHLKFDEPLGQSRIQNISRTTAP